MRKVEEEGDKKRLVIKGDDRGARKEIVRPGRGGSVASPRSELLLTRSQRKEAAAAAAVKCFSSVFLRQGLTTSARKRKEKKNSPCHLQLQRRQQALIPPLLPHSHEQPYKGVSAGRIRATDALESRLQSLC